MEEKETKFLQENKPDQRTNCPIYDKLKCPKDAHEKM